MIYSCIQSITEEQIEYSHINFKSYVSDELFRGLGLELQKNLGNTIKQSKRPERGTVEFKVDIVAYGRDEFDRMIREIVNSLNDHPEQKEIVTDIFKKRIYQYQPSTKKYI